jgi:hypothetical protein
MRGGCCITPRRWESATPTRPQATRNGTAGRFRPHSSVCLPPDLSRGGLCNSHRGKRVPELAADGARPPLSFDRRSTDWRRRPLGNVADGTLSSPRLAIGQLARMRRFRHRATSALFGITRRRRRRHAVASRQGPGAMNYVCQPAQTAHIVRRSYIRQAPTLGAGFSYSACAELRVVEVFGRYSAPVSSGAVSSQRWGLASNLIAFLASS